MDIDDEKDKILDANIAKLMPLAKNQPKMDLGSRSNMLNQLKAEQSELKLELVKKAYSQLCNCSSDTH